MLQLQRLSFLAAALGVALAVSGCAIGGSKTTTVTVTRTVTSPAGPKKPPAAEAETASVKYFGIPVKATKLDAKRYALKLKPEFFLVGVTANVAFAAGQQNTCQPLDCKPVEDDRWVIPAGTQDLLFVLPAKATGTVLTLSGPERQMQTAKITAAQLSALVGGAKKPKLMEPLDSGLWVTVNVDTVTTFAQQFQP
ncbi:MAG TPA: hypothetical protein VMU72_00670 [Gaiellaceae bacterium]|nr:hypothetical protein [Gaiellaceae bacterium]